MNQPNLAFYSAAATIFPLLFITLTITGEGLINRAREEHWYSQLRALAQLLGIFAIYISGEVLTLRVLLAGHASQDQSRFIQSALAVGAGLVVLGVLLDRARDIGPVAKNVAEWGVSLGTVAAAVVLLVS